MRHTTHRISSVSAVIAVLACGPPLWAQAGAQQGCTAVQHREFDFWVGEWEVVDSAGQPAGRNRITSELDGCVLREEWAGARGGFGSSLNVYHAAAGRWHQSWVDTGGMLLMLDGGLRADGAMVMEGERPGRDGGTVRHRITWTPQGPDKVRQLWEVTDDGQSWRVAFDGMYRRTSQTRAADPADVATPQALVTALYAMVTRRPGESFDWTRGRTLFLPSARLIPNTEQKGGAFRVLTLDEFIAWVDENSLIAGQNDQGFQEEEIATRIEQYGDIAHAFSTYQKHFHGSADILGRGINSIQMVRHEGRWWVSQIVWDEESGAGTIPAKYLAGDPDR
jgi:hypothetical protein